MPQKNSQIQNEYIEIFKFVRNIFEYFYDDDTIFNIFTDLLNSNLRKDEFNTLLHEQHFLDIKKYFLDIKKCLNVLEKEILNGNKLTYIAHYRDSIYYTELESEDFLKDHYVFLADKGMLEPHAIYPNLKKREIQETLPRTFKQLFIERKRTYDHVQPQNTEKYFQNNKLGRIITEIMHNIEKNQISTLTLKKMPLKTFLTNFETFNWRISIHTKTTLWQLFCA